MIRFLYFILPLAFFYLQNRASFMGAFNVPSHVKPVESDSCRLHISNNSSLKRMPCVLQDISTVLNQSPLEQEGILSPNGFTIVLDDARRKTFDTSASVIHRWGDTVFYLEINRFNSRASDRALAVTLIHEIMHCILTDIDQRARSGDKAALSVVRRFDERIEDTEWYVKYPFFDLMNQNAAGQHELMYQLFFEEMVQLLECFMQVHKVSTGQREGAEVLMWSGLQETSGFQKLSLDEQKEIRLAILEEKGISSIAVGN
jgi:hypothetical protein